ncbi:DNA-binding response regulator [Leptospira fluminis]|uniref:DNA-binding response regulator n=1 Tax=Leptospira fluminis TaxID=2484979 RepID=A0A4R9GQ14_9LEPT|nr:response regulator transcription factor [Leptospira fluminis]TGK19319.1 DNA-binding response regulator [Leptospira fluminis]
MISVVLADDHALIREGLKKVLEKENDISVVFEAERGQQVLDFLDQEKPNVVILDINLPDMSGLDAIHSVQDLSPGTFVLVLSVYSEERFAVRALKSGAAGYLSKASAADELISAIRKVFSGERYISQATAETIIREMSRPQDKMSHESLSNREFQIMFMLIKGKSVRDISSELELSISTVHTYRGRILAKMNLKSTQELVFYAFDQGLIQ